MPGCSLRRPGWEIEHRVRRADDVGQRHQGAAVEPAAHGPELVTDVHLGDDALERRLDEAHPKVFGQCPPVVIIEVLRIDRHPASAAINFNGGNYDAGGTFLAFIDGDGTITFNNASTHADVLKVGALGTNGVLNIGGGTLSADTTLKLYAPGSAGQLNFMSNVTLGGNSVKILAANSVTIFNNVVVTIGGPNPADVYTGFTGEIPNANYTGFGGNGSTTGTFAGAGANNPQPLSNAPAFDDPPPATVATTSRTTSTSVKSSTLSTSSGTTSTKLSSQTLSSTTVTSSDKIVDRNLKTSSKTGTGSTINISDSNQLLSLLDGVAAGPDGKVTVSGSKSSSNLKNLSGMNSNGLSSGERRMIIQQMREHGTTRIAGKRIL